MKSIKIIAALSLACLSAHSFAQSLPVGKYSDASMSDGYKKTLIYKFSGVIELEQGQKTSALISSESSPGELVKYKGKRLLKIEENISMVIGGTELPSKSYTYVDPSSFKEVYSLDLGEGEFSTIEYLNDYPDRMNVGEKIILKKEETISVKKPKKVISRSLTALSLLPLKDKVGLYEFCENVAIYKSETGFKEPDSSGGSCIVLNNKGENVGVFMDLVFEGAEMRLTGTIEAK